MKRFKRILTLVLAAVMLAGTVSAAEAEVYSEEWWLEKKIFSWSWSSNISSEMPEEYKDHFSSILSLERKEGAYVKVTKVKKSYEYNVLLISIEGFTNNCKLVYDGATPHLYSPDNSYLNAMLLDRETNTPIGFDNFNSDYTSYVPGLDPEATKIIDDILIKLPEDYDPEKHKLVLFWHIDCNNGAGPVLISEPTEVDTSKGGCFGNGDVNGDKKVNISDVITILKYVAKWNLPEFSFSNADLDMNGIINYYDYANLLKHIAGWKDFKKLKATEYIENLIKGREQGDNDRKNLFLDSPYYGETEQWERNIRAELWRSRYACYALEDVEKRYLKYSRTKTFCEYKNWTEEDFKQFLYKAYYAENWLVPLDM